MVKKIKSIAFYYGLPLLAFVLLLLLIFTIPRLSGINLDLTWLIILTMIATAWYFGRGPGLLFAILFEATLIYFSTQPFTAKSLIITFNRLILFGSVVLFASARRNAERKLREQKELLQVTISSIGDAVIATDLNGTINFINPTAEALTGWENAEAADKSLNEVFHIVNEDTRETVENPFAAVIREGKTVGLANHTVLITKDGKEIPIEDSGAPIKDPDGNIIGVILVFHDVTERRRTERERERLLKREQTARNEAETAGRMKDEFLATVSHELRTPLSAILGWSAMLKESNLEEATVRDGLGIIERNAKAQAEIIGDILDVSSIITGKLQIDSRPVKLAPIIEAAVDTLRPAILAKSITLRVSIETGENLVFGDAARLQQIIWNLISNAIKFTPESGNVEIKLQKVDSYLEISVHDNGIGIDKKLLPFIFERFRQGDSSTTRAHGGLGLGLAIVRHLIELHGGTVSAKSRGEGYGSTFTIRLPAADEQHIRTFAESSDHASDKRHETNNHPTQKANLEGLRILLVDDDRDTLEILSIVLRQNGAEVRAAASSKAAIEVFSEWKPDVLVSDIGMPEEDGFMLIKKIRALPEEDGGNVPAAALTAYVSEKDNQQAISAGYQIHIPKPVDPSVIAQMVAKLVKQKKDQ